jgi:DNA helicase-2/ATP-dependent DNA helicase PcrA
MNDQERIFEIKRLADVLTEIRSQLGAGAADYRETRAELREALTDYWENVYTDLWDEAQFVETVARQRSIAAASYQRQLQLRKLADSPYFARIDFAEDRPGGRGPAEPIYIGIATLTDRSTGALLIYDWRSPVAGMFYDFERGRAHYQCPIGTITGLISLKRQFKITDGRMEYLFDSDIKIDDEILQQILSRSADAKMRTIITSIQREQNQIIRDDAHRFLLVQGPAGSGKTSIALHRAAFLLYRERNALTAKNILIFSPNRIFSDYISNVLPELGEENVLQTTFHDYVTRIQSQLGVVVEERDEQLEFLYGGTADPDYAARVAGTRYKSSAGFIRMIRDYLALLEAKIRDYPGIEFLGEAIMSQEEWRRLFFQELSYLPPARRLAQIKRLIQLRLRPLIHQLREAEEQKIAASGEEVNERTIKALARIAVKEAMEEFIAVITNRTELDPLALYRRLYEDEELFGGLAGGRIPPEWPAIRSFTADWLSRGQIPYEDAAAFLFFQGSLNGFPVRDRIRHLVIDEAQDYSLLQYEILKRLFPKSAWTVLGDPAQSIHPYLETVDFEAAAALLKAGSPDDANAPRVIRLTRSYRSTREIQAFCQGLLPELSPVEQIQRPGPLPRLVLVQTRDSLAAPIAGAISALRAEGWNSIAVITKTLREATEAYRGLKNRTELFLVTPEISEFRRGAVILPSYLAKGLEFDAVLVYDVSAAIYDNEAERNLLYTVCTRALHRLILYCSGEPSPLLPAAKDRYEVSQA